MEHASGPRGLINKDMTLYKTRGLTVGYFPIVVGGLLFKRRRHVDVSAPENRPPIQGTIDARIALAAAGDETVMGVVMTTSFRLLPL